MLELSLKALQVVLGLGALALAATTLVSAARSSPSSEIPRSSIDAGLPPATDASLPRYTVIADRNLFKLKEKPAPPVEPKIVESKLQVQLLGTVAASATPEQRSLAIVRDTNGEVVTLNVGDLFADKRAKLVKVEPRRIVLEQNGQLEAVLLEDQEAPLAPLARRSPPPGMPPGAAGLPAGSGMLGLARNMAQPNGSDAVMMAMFRQFASQMVGSVERDANGRLSGFRIQRINEGSPLLSLGLQAGDAIRGINGQSLGAEGAIVQMLAMSGGADSRWTVEDRSGRAREIVVSGAALQRLVPK